MLKKFITIAFVASVASVANAQSNDLGPAPALRRQLFINNRADMGGPQNARSNKMYSTIPYDTDLKTIGAKFVISHDDKFDHVPPAGTGGADYLSKSLEMKSLSKVESEAWAQKRLNSDFMEKHVVPRPKQSLVGKELTVIAAEQFIPPSHPVFCHLSEVERWFCHESHDTTDITKVTVTTNDSNIPSVVWTACHDEEQYWCHIINVDDVIFVPIKKDTDNCTAFASKFTSDIKTALKDEEVMVKLCGEVDNSSLESVLQTGVLVSNNDLCAKEVMLLLLQKLHEIQPTYSVTQLCIPELTKEKMLMDPYLDATVCGAECIEFGAGLISGLIVTNSIKINTLDRLAE